MVMALRTSALAVACIAIAAGTGLMTPGNAQTDDLFLFTACNDTRASVSVALVSRLSSGSNVWRRHGWYVVAAGQCRYVGAFPKGYFYFYAFDGRGGEWVGPGGKTACVNLRVAFDQTYSGAHSCLPGETIVAINEVVVDTPEFAIVLDN
jgi:uncharacterized membrane protein